MPGKEYAMAGSLMIRAVAGALAVLVFGVVVLRRKRTA
jgi:hypothetical protein